MCNKIVWVNVYVLFDLVFASMLPYIFTAPVSCFNQTFVRLKCQTQSMGHSEMEVVIVIKHLWKIAKNKSTKKGCFYTKIVNLKTFQDYLLFRKIII